ncbi:MAG: hypothetical protein K2X47_10165 [Bdellovibrionales bacterium]|nr:hypothetical protein [Bdellovibrionales bacterium]
MKFVSLGVLLLVLIFSWRETQRPGDIPAAIHFSLQSELQQFIQKYISENVASAKDIKFHRLWTKPVDIDTVDAQFEYSFLSQSDGEGVAKTLLAGSARLNRVPGKEAASEGWSLARVQIDDQTIEFEQGVLIRSDGNPAPEAPPEDDAPAAPKAPGGAHEESHH